MTPRFASAALVLAVAVGCGGGVPKEKLARAREAVVDALEAWKRQEKPAHFTDPALTAGQKLLDYEILRTEADREGTIRTFAKLTLRDRRGKQAQRQVAYMVNLDSSPIVSNDPMF